MLRNSRLGKGVNRGQLVNPQFSPGYFEKYLALFDRDLQTAG
jgi:hypothetical protein